MAISGDYPGPSRDDYVNVLALNTAFLDAAYDLKGPQKGRLAAAPFLLFSLRENDLDWWSDALAEHGQHNLLTSALPRSVAIVSLQTATICFLWQLAHRNPYAARIISGASIAWCEKISGLPLLTVLERAATRSDVMSSRLGDLDSGASMLMDKGASSLGSIRRSAHVVALQALLTHSRVEHYHQLPAAACKMAIPALSVSEKKL